MMIMPVSLNSLAIHWTPPAAASRGAAAEAARASRRSETSATVSAEARSRFLDWRSRDSRGTLDLAAPRTVLEALIVQMGGTARPSGKGNYVDVRI